MQAASPAPDPSPKKPRQLISIEEYEKQKVDATEDALQSLADYVRRHPGQLLKVLSFLFVL